MPVPSYSCPCCGRTNRSQKNVCAYCGWVLVHSQMQKRNIFVQEEKSAISRRVALLGLAGSIGAITLGVGVWTGYTLIRKKHPQLLTYTGHHGIPIKALIWSPDGNSIATGDAHGTVHIWDTSTGTTTLTCQEPAAQSISSLAWSPDYTTLLAGHTNMLVNWDIQSGKALFTTTRLTGPAAYSPLGNYKPCYLLYPALLAACQNQQSVLVFPSDSLKTPITSFDPGSISALAFNPDVEALNLALVTANPDQSLAVYNPIISNTCAQNDDTNTTISYTGTSTLNLAPSDAGELSFPWGPGGSYLLAGSLPSTVTIKGTWGTYEMDHPTGVVAAALNPAEQSLPAGANPDGWYTVIGYIATADSAGIVRIWGNDQKYLLAMQTTQSVLQLVWSPDGNFLAVIIADGTVQVWQADLSNLAALWRNTSFN